MLQPSETQLGVTVVFVVQAYDYQQARVTQYFFDNTHVGNHLIQADTTARWLVLSSVAYLFAPLSACCRRCALRFFPPYHSDVPRVSNWNMPFRQRGT